MGRVLARYQVAFAALVCLASVVLVLGESETVFVTKTGTKYHRATCNSLRASKTEMVLGEAATRYGPCATCKPPVVAAPSDALQSLRASGIPTSKPTAVSASTRVFVTRTGQKYHREGCRTTRAGAIASTLGEASTRLGPCAVCQPPVLHGK